MTRQFLDEWLADRAYYRISLIPPADEASGIGTENPDQRIAEDLRAFIGDSVAGVRGILFARHRPAVQHRLAGQLHRHPVDAVRAADGVRLPIPGYMVWVALIYAIAGTVATHLVGRPLALLNFRKQRVEADFRFALVRLRENTEGVALYGGEEEEKRGLLVRFEALVGNWWQLMRRYKLLTALTAGYGQVASVFPIVVAAPRYFAGLIPLGALTQTAGAFGQVQGAMSWFVDSYADIAAWRATVERLATFHRAIERARAAAGEGGAAGARRRRTATRCAHATLALPGGETLLRGRRPDAARRASRWSSAAAPGRANRPCSGRLRASGRSAAARCGARPGQRTVPAAAALYPARHAAPCGELPRRRRTRTPTPRSREALEAVGLGELATRLDDEENWSAAAFRRRAAAARAGARAAGAAGLAVPGRGHREPRPRGRGGALPPAARTAARDHHRLDRAPPGGGGVARSPPGVPARCARAGAAGRAARCGRLTGGLGETVRGGGRLEGYGGCSGIPRLTPTLSTPKGGEGG